MAALPTALLGEAKDEVVELTPSLRVEPRGGLVQEQQLGPAHHPMATSSRRRCPPDSLLICLLACSVRPTAATSSSASYGRSIRSVEEPA
jgi:hypothetical protein